MVKHDEKWESPLPPKYAGITSCTDRPYWLMMIMTSPQAWIPTLSCLLNGALTRGAVTKTLRVIEPGTWWQSLLAKPPVYYHSFRFRFWVHPGSVRLRHTPKIRNRNYSYKLVFCSQTMVDSLIENFSLAFNFDFRWVWGPSLTYASKFLLCQNIVTLDLSFRLDFKLGLSSSLTEG